MVHSIIQITFFSTKHWQSFVNLVDISLSEKVGSSMFFFEMYQSTNSKLFDVEQKREAICPN